MILDTIKSPQDLKKLSIEQLETLAGEIRTVICDVVSQNGGHLAPSLGAVEHTVPDSPKVFIRLSGTVCSPVANASVPVSASPQTTCSEGIPDGCCRLLRA